MSFECRLNWREKHYEAFTLLSSSTITAKLDNASPSFKLKIAKIKWLHSKCLCCSESICIIVIIIDICLLVNTERAFRRTVLLWVLLWVRPISSGVYLAHAGEHSSPLHKPIQVRFWKCLTSNCSLVGSLWVLLCLCTGISTFDSIAINAALLPCDKCGVFLYISLIFCGRSVTLSSDYLKTRTEKYSPKAALFMEQHPIATCKGK